MEKKVYIQPEQTFIGFENPLMQVPSSLPQGNGGDPVVDDEDDVLSKSREKGFEGWGDLW